MKTTFCTTRVQSTRGLTLAFCMVTVCVIVMIFFAAAGSTPWKSFTGDLDHDGAVDVAYHANLEQCVEHIQALKVDGSCGLQCNRLGQCMTVVKVENGIVGPPTGKVTP